MSNDELAKYHLLTGKAFSGASMSDEEMKEWNRLGETYKEVVSAVQKAQVAESNAAIQERLKRERDEAERKRRAEDLGHHLSFLRSVLNPKVDDATLEAKWLAFRADLGDPQA